MSSMKMWIKCMHAQSTLSTDEKVQEKHTTGVYPI